ncbi:MAG: UvrB/UvrC motif-containing protein [Oscillospiraceae bacterium]|nr:UvrB/UvrC motif-containing protein [Oscillospiraceae bacterium]
MKCEKCGKEATFYYSSNVNGLKTERHLCADCARAEGFADGMWQPSFSPFSNMDSMFDGMLQNFFMPEHTMFPTFDGFGFPARRMMYQAPQVHIIIGQPQTGAPMSEAEAGIPTDAGEDIKARRQRESLKQQLDEAVRDENFEKAIELRDQLKKLDG